MRTYRVTGTYALGDGGAYPEGRMVEFRPVVRGVSDGVIVLPQPVVAPIVGGNLSVDLVASAGEDWWWRVREPGEPDRHFDLAGDFDLAELESRLPPYVQVVGTPSERVSTGGFLRWRGAFPDALPPYGAGDVVRDGAWLMVASRDTDERPTPHSTGLPVWMMEGVEPVAHNSGEHSVMCGVRIAVDHRFAVVVKGVRVWVVDPQMRHTLWLVPNSTTVPEWARVDFTPTAPGWCEVPVDSATFLPGMVFDALVEVTATEHAAQQTVTWNYQHVTAGVTPPAPGEVMMSPKQPDLMLISDLDASLADRSALVRSIRPGDTISVRDTTYAVVDSIRTGDEPYQRVIVAPAGVVSGIDRPSTPFTITTHVGPTDAQVGRIDMHWMNPWLSETITGAGLYSTTGRGGLHDDMHGWGVDLLARKVEIPGDWEILTTSVNAIPAVPDAVAAMRELRDALETSGSFEEFKGRIGGQGGVAR